jgi:hypothetical protein
MLLPLVLSICAFSSRAIGDVTITTQPTIDPGKILIVYLSRTNNTKALAEIIHKNIGGKLVRLELQNPYPEDYKAIVDQVVKENETGFLPPLLFMTLCEL